MPAELEKRIATAGRILLEQSAYFTQHFGKVESHWKADSSRVTEADLTLSRNILSSLRALYPDDDSVSEEELPSIEEGPRTLRKRFCWVLDPIDGTNNYALGLPLCGILLALLEDGLPAYGWTYDPLGKRLVEGGPGHGLRVNGVRVPAPPQPASLDRHAFVTLHFPQSAENLRRLAPLLSHSTGRCLGSAALHFVYNVLGVVDGSFCHSGKVWDIAAGHAQLAAVGRRMIFLETDPFPLHALLPKPPNLPNLAGTEAFLRFTLPLFEKTAH
ncbi:MAG: inositol monophosphatase [Puniceicoccales bacterium]|jgi:myo-inositol-1(or 4)-monophosphatase|nr:inositol monophosphatase [Puniceicoccales bacterium]